MSSGTENAMRIHSTPLNASTFRNFKESMQNIVRLDQEFYSMNSIKESLAYSKKFQLEVLAMI